MLRVIHAWAVAFARGPRDAWKHLITLEKLEVCDLDVTVHRLTMRPLLLAMMVRISEAAPLGASILNQLPPRPTFARDMLEIAVANMLIYGGRYQQAQRLVDAARSRPGARRSGLSFVLSEAAEGAIDLTQGRLRQALGRLKLAVNSGVRDCSRDTNGNTMAATLWAEALYEAGRCEQARRLLSVNVPLIRHVGVPRQLITAHVILARILEGERERAFELLTELEHIGYQERMPRAVAGARLERVHLLTVDGHVADAKAELKRCCEQFVKVDDIGTTMGISDVETIDVAMARCALAARRGDQSVASLRACCERRRTRDRSVAA